jgi:hypothetical protein
MAAARQTAGDWRDPAIFGRFETRIEAVSARHGARRGRKLNQSALSPRLMTALDGEVSEFVAGIRTRCPTLILIKRRALPTKRLIQSLTGSGRPVKPEITKAAKLNARQQREVKDGTRFADGLEPDRERVFTRLASDAPAGKEKRAEQVAKFGWRTENTRQVTRRVRQPLGSRPACREDRASDRAVSIMGTHLRFGIVRLHRVVDRSPAAAGI